MQLKSTPSDSVMSVAQGLFEQRLAVGGLITCGRVSFVVFANNVVGFRIDLETGLLAGDWLLLCKSITLASFLFDFC